MVRQRPGAVLPAWAWLWFPPVMLAIIVPVRVLDPAAYHRWFDAELGVIELMTPLVAFMGAVYGARILLALRGTGTSLLSAWAALMTLACIYFAGEELSWGQHLFGWATPEAIERLNDQQETNLHNVSSWFDQKPRLLLELWVLVGGIVMPLRGYAGAGMPVEAARIGTWLWPTRDCLPTAVLAILVRLPERIKDIADLERLPYELRYSEPQEYYFGLFLLLYLAALFRRVSAARDAVPSPRPA